MLEQQEDGDMFCTECGRVYDDAEGMVECPSDVCPSHDLLPE